MTTIELPQSKQILPSWITNRTDRRAFTRWAKAHATHSAIYHGVRSPLYLGQLLSYTPRGFGRSVWAGFKWTFDWDSRPMRQSIIAERESDKFVPSQRLHSERVAFRVKVAGFTTAATVGAGLTAAYLGTGIEQAGLVASTLGAFGFIGRPEDGSILEPAHIPVEAQKLSADVVREALVTIGVASMRDADQIPTPLVVRDKAGWRAEVDLPAGITAAQVIAKRENLAAALSRPLDSVWPECDTATSPGRLVLWVGDSGLSTMIQQLWPLTRAARLDIFEPFAFGLDAKGNTINLSLAENNMLIGAIPGAGKTTTLRNVLLGSMLDPRTELWLWEFKGTGDFDALAPVATRFGSGPDDETVASALAGLRELRAECSRRASIIKALGAEAPEHKVTSELANREGLHPLVVAIDESQCLFQHSRHGKEAGELAEQIIKLGRALGIILLIATQRPDKDSLPTGISANVSTRFCLRVLDHISNDMILGTSAHQRGIRANTITSREKGVGYLLGQHDEAQIVRVFNPSAQEIYGIVDAAVALRQGQSNPAVVPETLESQGGLLVDVITAFGNDTTLQYVEIVERLQNFGDRYAGFTSKMLGSDLRKKGIESRQVFKTADKTNRWGVRLHDVIAACDEMVSA